MMSTLGILTIGRANKTIIDPGTVHTLALRAGRLPIRKLLRNIKKVSFLPITARESERAAWAGKVKEGQASVNPQ